MYLHLGQDCIINMRNILGIFDIDNTSLSRDTREFLRRAEADGRVVNICTDLPKSFLIQSVAPYKVYVCQISASTLRKRCDQARGGQLFL